MMLILVSNVVQAQELEGGGQFSAVGQTAVTARVEMPEDAGATSDVKTGDNSKAFIYSALFVMSSLVILIERGRKIIIE